MRESRRLRLVVAACALAVVVWAFTGVGREDGEHHDVDPRRAEVEEILRLVGHPFTDEVIDAILEEERKNPHLPRIGDVANLSDADIVNVIVLDGGP